MSFPLSHLFERKSTTNKLTIVTLCKILYIVINYKGNQRAFLYKQTHAQLQRENQLAIGL